MFNLYKELFCLQQSLLLDFNTNIDCKNLKLIITQCSQLANEYESGVECIDLEPLKKRFHQMEENFKTLLGKTHELKMQNIELIAEMQNLVCESNVVVLENLNLSKTVIELKKKNSELQSQCSTDYKYLQQIRLEYCNMQSEYEKELCQQRNKIRTLTNNMQHNYTQVEWVKSVNDQLRDSVKNREKQIGSLQLELNFYKDQCEKRLACYTNILNYYKQQFEHYKWQVYVLTIRHSNVKQAFNDVVNYVKTSIK